MREFLVRTITVAATVMVMLLLAEGLLRLAPSLIGIAALERFEPALRVEIVTRLGLATRADRNIIPSEQRSDKGPDLKLHWPNRRYVRPVDDADLAVGGADSFETDALGFCNPLEILPRKPIHALTIGGSIPNCAATTAADNYTVRLGELLQINSYNLAVPGTGPYDYLETLRRFGGNLSPKIVVMTIAEADDLRDIERFHKFKTKKAKKPKPARESGSKFGIFSTSYALAFLKAGIELTVKTIREGMGLNFRYSVLVQNKRTALNIHNGDVYELQLAHRVSEGKVSPALYEDSVLQFAALAEKMGFIPLVVLVPAVYTVYADTIEYEDKKIAPVMRAYSDMQRKWLADNSDRLGVKFFDSTAKMRELSKARPLLFFPSNVHLTAEGHKALAEAVAPAVENLLRP